jgi:hypothetical protein
MRKLLSLAAAGMAVLATQSLFAQVVSPNVVGLQPPVTRRELPAWRSGSKTGNSVAT